MNSEKTIHTLLEDINEMMYDGVDVPESFLKEFSENICSALKKSLKEGCKAGSRIRMSNIGTPPRKLWYQLNGYEGSAPTPNLARQFIYGHMIEAFMLLLAKTAGHSVTDAQKEVELDGIKGHQDAKIDGVLVDVKGMSAFGFDKFDSRRVLKDDSFGYIAQISGYAQAQEGVNEAGFFVFDKLNGRMCLMLVDGHELVDARSKIATAKATMEKNEPPIEKCYEPVPLGEAGNLALAKSCEWCAFKRECWKDANDGTGLRGFKYSNGIQHLVKIVKEPKVEEILYHETAQGREE